MAVEAFCDDNIVPMRVGCDDPPVVGNSGDALLISASDFLWCRPKPSEPEPL
jgi:hypothetical protein